MDMQMSYISNLKRFVFYFLYSTFVIIVTLGGYKLIEHLRSQIIVDYNPEPFLIFAAFYPLVIGLVIGLPNIISRAREQGKWKCDWILILSIGIPSSYATFTRYLRFTPIGKYIPFMDYIIINDLLYNVGGVVLGYTILYSFKKIKNSVSSND